MKSLNLKISTEVAEALQTNKPVVALESTIITHGMEYPVNLSTAQDVESVIRSANAVPATIAVINGIPHIGLSSEELEYVAQNASSFVKATTRDLPYCLANNKNCSTTVASTMVLANLAGIKVFVTGGIGGVHLEGEKTMDISADLTELSRTPVIVVSAGIKSILDVGRTLEVLETLSVPVFGYKTDRLPEFFFSEGDYDAPNRVESASEIVDIYTKSEELNLRSGMLVAVPVPKELESDRTVVKKAIADALAEAKEKNITGSGVTPFLLKRVRELSGGESLEANIALIKNNALVGAQIAEQFSYRK